MASLRDIRTRIKSVKNTQKITGAMKLVAASKLKKAQEAIEHARPYARELGKSLERVAASTSGDADEAAHPLLEQRDPKRVLLVVVTSDRGLCGAFNSNILKRAELFLYENRDRFEHIELATVGRRAADHFKKKATVTARDYPGIFNNLSFRRATEIAEGLAKEFLEKDLDAVYLLYNEFKSAISQVVQLEPLLPVRQEELPESASPMEYIYEPSADAVLNSLLPRYVAILVWRALLESHAAEHGARMSAMDAATKNAIEMCDSLTLLYNRARQAAITQELMEIVGGAEAISAA